MHRFHKGPQNIYQWQKKVSYLSFLLSKAWGSFSDLFIHLKGRMTEKGETRKGRGRKEGEGGSSIHWYTAQTAYNQGWVRPKPEARISICVSHMGDRGPRICAAFCCLPKHISRKLNEKRDSEDSNKHSDTGCWHRKWLLNWLQPSEPHGMSF